MGGCVGGCGAGTDWGRVSRGVRGRCVDGRVRGWVRTGGRGRGGWDMCLLVGAGRRRGLGGVGWESRGRHV